MDSTVTSQDAVNYAALQAAVSEGLPMTVLPIGHDASAVTVTRIAGRALAMAADLCWLRAKPRSHPKAGAPTHILDR
ncbi:hypothetical protein SBBP1_380029 [Burkholderiales bacterium]|nr:hypothetical protein SBBP1_380029 [Burkholderiales bacterium]